MIQAGKNSSFYPLGSSIKKLSPSIALPTGQAGMGFEFAQEEHREENPWLSVAILVF